MGLFKKLFGICDTQPPADPSCWKADGGRVTVDLGKASELSKPGGAIRLEGQGLTEKVLVFQGDDGEFHALRNKCTHGGRRLDPVAGTNEVRCCSMGQSRFDYAGKCQDKELDDLVTYEVQKTDDGLVVTVG